MSQVNILKELESYKVKTFSMENEHVKVLCPFHGDGEKPNLSIRIEGNGPLGWSKCFSCGISVSFIQLLVRYHELTNQANPSHRVPTANELANYLASKYNLKDSEPTLEPKLIEEFHGQIWNAETLLKELAKRAVTPDLIRKYRLGRDNVRITIPITNEFGRYVDVLRYLPGDKTGTKFQSLKTRGKNRLFPMGDQFKFKKIVLTAGPIKAIAGTRLNEHGFGCVTALAGEASWDSKFNEYFSGKEVFVVMDTDKAGQHAGLKRCVDLYAVTDAVYNILLPFDVEKGGLDDFMYRVGVEALVNVLNKAEKYAPPQVKVLDDSEPEKLTLTQVFSPEKVAKRVEVPVRVTGVCNTPYYAPKSYTVHCEKDAKPQGTCQLCPVYQFKGEGFFTQTIHPESDSILTVVEKNRIRINDAMRMEIGIPGNCNRHTFKVLDYQMVDEVRISPLMDLSQTVSEREDQPAFCAERVDANSSYTVTGRMYPHPDTQKATLVLSRAKSISDDISGWKLDRDLKVFQPLHKTVTGINDQYSQILLFLERQVTHIHQRPEMHALIDLIYHTPLFFNFNGRLQNGWGQGLIIGDSGQGKSESVNHIMDFYRLGAKVDCKNASLAGLLGGCAPLDSGSKKQFIKWGALPANDRKLLVMEEIGGCPIEALNKLTNARSEGIAQLPKIENKSTKCRTRIVAPGNSRSMRPMASYSHGVDAIFEIFNSPADIRRFDVAIIVAESGNKPFPNPNEHLHFFADQEQFRASVLFAWTRNETQLVFEDELRIIEHADRLCGIYTEDRIPLINKGGTRYKIAKLAAALACRLFSTEDGERVLVKNEHVDWIVQFLERIYEDPQTGYRRFSDGMRALNTLIEPGWLESELRRVPYLKSLVDGLMRESYIERQDLMDWGGIDYQTAQTLISTLVRCNAMLRRGRSGGYVKTPGFVDFLRTLDVDTKRGDGNSPPTDAGF
jgi:hypothetical protein